MYFKPDVDENVQLDNDIQDNMLNDMQGTDNQDNVLDNMLNDIEDNVLDNTNISNENLKNVNGSIYVNEVITPKYILKKTSKYIRYNNLSDKGLPTTFFSDDLLIDNNKLNIFSSFLDRFSHFCIRIAQISNFLE